MFGFLGSGWMYAGNYSKGIMFLIGFLAWHLFVAPLLPHLQQERANKACT
jgi:hypothetical protein